MKIVHNRKNLYHRRKELRNNSTSEEILLWLQLKNSKLGVKFRRQHSMGGYIVDFYCPSRKLVVEVDGSRHFAEENKEYDRARTRFLNGLGLKVIRFSNTEIKTKLGAVIQKIKAYF